MNLVLASTSPYRRALLERLGVPFTCVAPTCDEEAHKDRGLGPLALAELLAEEKARSVATSRPTDVVLGGDQVCAIGDRILDKPGTTARACAQLALLQGRPHQLVTAIHLCVGDRTRAHTDVTTLRMRPLSDEDIARYVAADHPEDCAGSYKFEARGVALFEAVEGSDVTAITGIPLLALARLLRELGFSIP